MNVLVLYDTQFGNTGKIAQAISSVLQPLGIIRLQNTRRGGPVSLEGVDLLIVGGPTQRQRLTGELKSVLEAIPRRSLQGVRTAAFDTRYRHRLAGSAASKIEQLLKKTGAQKLVPAESFFITMDEPPEGEKRRHALEGLEPGELERAAAWAQQIASSAGLE